MICPFATYKPITVNHGGTRSARIGLVIHVQEGNGSLYGWFSNPAAEVSAHFWCAKDGSLEQYLDTNVVAWAEDNGNDSYASCEFEGFDTEPMTAAQLATGSRLASWLAQGEGWPIVGPVAHGTPGVTSHSNPDGTPDPAWGDHPCPGTIRLAQIPTIVHGAAPPAPPSKQENESMTSQISGGQLHVWGVVNNVSYHWWQSVGGNPVGQPSWYVERLPQP